MLPIDNKSEFILPPSEIIDLREPSFIKQVGKTALVAFSALGENAGSLFEACKTASSYMTLPIPAITAPPMPTVPVEELTDFGHKTANIARDVKDAALGLMLLTTRKALGLKSDSEEDVTDEAISSASASPDSLDETEWTEIPNGTEIDRFCSRISDQLCPKQVEELVTSGKVVLHAIFHDEAIEQPQNPETVVSKIIWALMFCAYQKGQDFAEGAFLIEDKEQKLHAFFNKLGIAYERPSSHLKGQNIQAPHGIDNLTLPHQKAHALLTPVTQMDGSHWLFIKPEKWGVKGLAVFMHGAEYIHSRAKKIAPSVFGNDQGEGLRKERIPDEERELFLIATEGFEGRDVALSEIGQKDTGHGIKSMYRYICAKLDENNNNLSGDQRQRLVDLKATLENRHDHINYRTGHEVILLQQDFDL